MNHERDTKARELAQSVFDRPLVLEAGAGTGKTTALVARVVCWVLGPGWSSADVELRRDRGQAPADEELAAKVLEGVVAITFTEAAAAEMETRVGSVLSQISAGRLPDYLLQKSLPSEAAIRAQRAECLLGALDRLQVRTIHAWCHRLLGRFPLEAGLHPDFQVDADGQSRRDAANEVVEEHLRKAYHESVAPALLLLASDGKGPNDLADALTELCAQGLRAEELLESPFSPERIERFTDELISLLEEPGEARLRGLAEIKRAGNTKKLLEWMLSVSAELRTAPPQNTRALVRFLSGLCEAETKASTSKLYEWSKERFTKGELEVFSSEDREFFRDYSHRLRAQILGLQRLDPQKLEAARWVLQPLLQELEQRLHTRGVLSYEDLLRRTKRLLDADNGVRQLLRDEIDQLLVDEFQDTNALQCEIVARLALQGPQEKRPGLFLVGDPKQSIYGWRGAELSSYHDFVAKLEKDHGPREYLNVNFRSVPPILREVERAVAPVMREIGGLQPSFQALLSCEANEDREGYVGEEQRSIEHWVSGMHGLEGLDCGGSSASTELETRRLVDDLLKLRNADPEGFEWSDVGLLYRSGGDLELYLRELRRAGIPYAVENDRQYFRRREIMDAVALVSCILDPANQVAMLGFLRSPWVGVPDAAWLGLWRHGFPQAFANLLRLDGESLKGIDDAIESTRRELGDALPALQRIQGWELILRGAVWQIAGLRESFVQDLPEHFVRKLREWTLVEHREASRFLGPYRAANLERFFRLLRNALCESNESPQALLRQLRRGVLEETEAQEGRLQASARDAVCVMTIHKAKGLDFEHVYLLQSHKQGRAPSQANKTELRHAKDAWEYQLLGYPSLGWRAALDRAEEVNRYERVRLLYVAITRPKQRLVTLGIRRQGDGDPLRAASLSELLGPRASQANLAERAEDALANEASCFVETISDGDQVLWRLLPSEDTDSDHEVQAVPAPPRAPLDELLANEATLMNLRQAASAHMARPFRRRASAGGHEDLRESRSESQAEETAPDRMLSLEPGEESRIAMAVGSAIHALLEHYDPTLPPEEAWERALPRVRQELLIQLAEPEVARAEKAAAEVLERMRSGSLLQRLRDLGPEILGREVPVLLAPDPEDEMAPVGYHPGAIDLLYRDPESGEIVVVDFKTDRVDDAASLESQVLAYRQQGKVYQRATAEALGLNEAPRFELWFLRTDHIEVCP